MTTHQPSEQNPFEKHRLLRAPHSREREPKGARSDGPASRKAERSLVQED